MSEDVQQEIERLRLENENLRLKLDQTLLEAEASKNSWVWVLVPLAGIIGIFGPGLLAAISRFLG